MIFYSCFHCVSRDCEGKLKIKFKQRETSEHHQQLCHIYTARTIALMYAAMRMCNLLSWYVIIFSRSTFSPVCAARIMFSAWADSTNISDCIMTLSVACSSLLVRLPPAQIVASTSKIGNPPSSFWNGYKPQSRSRKRARYGKKPN